MKTGIEAVIFDLGNVLIDFNQASALQKLQPYRKGSAAWLSESVSGRDLLHRFECGALTAAQFHAEACTLAGLSIGFETFCEIYCDIFLPVEEMIEASERLRRAGMPTYVFSNTSELHFSHIRGRYDFVSRFRGYFLSYELGCMKPQRASYEAVERGTGHVPDTLLYIDDLQENIGVAAKRGWRVIHHESPAQTLSKLRELGLV